MTDKHTPAFPLQETEDYHGQAGMSLRDYFAAKAMQGICARVQWSPRGIVETAYSVADAMMEARK